MKQVNIAILMSTYDGERYLDKQLNSLANQTLSEFVTVYIRDDGSKDKTLEVIDNWKDKINIKLFKGLNVGPAKSFWSLLTNTEIKADYYLFSDQDDVWDSEKVEKSIAVLEGDNKLSVCNCRIIDSNGELISKKRLISPPIINLESFFVSGVSQGCSMAFTDDLKRYINSLKISCIPMHDIILMFYGLNRGKIVWVDTPLFGYRVHKNNVVSKKNKSAIQRLITIFKNWNNGSNNSMGKVAAELLSNVDNYSEEEVVFLKAMVNYRKSIKNKLAVLFNSKFKGVDKACLRSYRIRIVLNLL